jgi:hypothetical protein
MNPLTRDLYYSDDVKALRVMREKGFAWSEKAHVPNHSTRRPYDRAAEARQGPNLMTTRTWIDANPHNGQSITY